MSKKKKMYNVSEKKENNTIKLDSESVWQTNKPLYNGWNCGYGVHGKTKYDRKANKKQLKRELREYDL